MSIVIIQGSSRKTGNTHKVVSLIRTHLDSDIIDLLDYNIHPYDYDHHYPDDDFMHVMCQIVEYDLIIFATPVYWYAMSGIMKNFFDRITDCLKTDKPTGRKLRGKSMAVISCGSDSTDIDGFFVPFQLSAEYLGMIYWGHMHTWVEEEHPSNLVKQNIAEFALKIVGQSKL